MKTVEEIVSVLTAEQKQVLKDCINHGGWGSGDMAFLNEKGETETDMMWGYYTNAAKEAGNFKGRKISGLFRGIYNRLCALDHEVGEVITHCTNWWGNGTGDMLFIRKSYVDAFEAWAKN